MAAKPKRSPMVFPTQVNTPPSSQPSTVAISAAQSETGINHKNPPATRKKAREKPEEAKVAYLSAVMTIEAVIAKKLKRVSFEVLEDSLSNCLFILNRYHSLSFGVLVVRYPDEKGVNGKRKQDAVQMIKNGLICRQIWGGRSTNSSPNQYFSYFFIKY